MCRTGCKIFIYGFFYNLSYVGFVEDPDWMSFIGFHAYSADTLAVSSSSLSWQMLSEVEP